MTTGTDRTVYLVDDDEAVRDSLKILLESCGFAVEDYPSGPAFLEAWRGGWRGCLVLDLHMPAMTGLQLLQAMRTRAVDLPAIVITGRADSATEVQAIEAGALAVLEKPVGGDVLVAMIARALAAPTTLEYAPPAQTA